VVVARTTTMCYFILIWFRVVHWGLTIEAAI